MSRRVVFIESLHNTEALFTRGLRSGASAQGWEVGLVFLRDSEGKQKTVAELTQTLLACRPDLIVFIMDSPLEWEGIWGDPILRSLPKIAFWFDDFIHSVSTMRRPDVWRRWQQEENVRVWIHDGYWREVWRLHTGGTAIPIDLAADPLHFSGSEDPAKKDSQKNSLYPELDRYAVMLGTVPSRDSLEAGLAPFPGLAQKWIRHTTQVLETAAWPFRPYEIAETVRASDSFFTAKEQIVLSRWLSDPEQGALIRHQLWRQGKRIARIRGLRAAVRRVPVAVLSGHTTEPFAREEELRQEIGGGSAVPFPFAFRDTTAIPAQEWGGLFRSGALHLQWVDPQSIESGAPFRMFETAAAGVPLLSDDRPGFGALFTPEQEMVFAPDEEAMAQRAEALLAGPPAVLRQTGARAREAFLARHTWAHRWRGVEAALEKR